VFNMKLVLCEKDIDQLIKLSEEKNIFLEGNIIKVIESDDENFKNYLKKAKEKDSSTRKKRLEITRQVQDQNRKLEEKAVENEKLMTDLKKALDEAEGAKEAAINDLDLIQKKSQFELMGQIIKVALWVIMGVGILTTLLYIVALYTKGSGPDTTLIGNTWSNLLGILLTNSFSIVGTIMGVKYASNDKKEE
tara:strand:- start:2112 stop:2687 length:576 start_codon:yes stop_codon:yes gene_type:complete